MAEGIQIHLRKDGTYRLSRSVAGPPVAGDDPWNLGEHFVVLSFPGKMPHPHGTGEIVDTVFVAAMPSSEPFVENIKRELKVEET